MAVDQEKGATIPEHERDTIQDVGLTNTEWLRYRLSSQLPGRVKDISAVRRDAQMKKYRERSPRRHASEPLPLTDDYEGTKTQVLHLTERADAAIQSIVHPSETGYSHVSVPQLRTSIFQFGNEYATEVVPVLTGFIEKHQTAIREALSRDDVTPEQRATLIDMLYRVEDQKPEGTKVTNELIDQVLDNNDFATIGELLVNQDGSQHITFTALQKKLDLQGGNISWDELVVHSLDPILQYIDTETTQSGLENMRSYFLLADIGNRLHDHPEEAQSVQQRGVDFQRVADTFFKTITTHRDTIEGGNPSHMTARTILETITSLYTLIPANERKKPKEMEALLKRFYDEKVKKYSSPSHTNYLNAYVDQTAEVFNIDKAEIKS